MTSKLRVLLAGALSVALAAWLPAASGADLKVGFVNVAKVVEKAPQAEAARARIESEFAPRDRDLVAQQKELRSLEDKLIRDGAVMAEAERNRLDNEIRNMKRDVRRTQEEFREDLNVRRNEELAKLQRMVFEAIQALAKSEKYDLILSDGVVYAGDQVDITDKLITTLERQQKKAGN